MNATEFCVIESYDKIFAAQLKKLNELAENGRIEEFRQLQVAALHTLAVKDRLISVTENYFASVGEVDSESPYIRGEVSKRLVQDGVTYDIWYSEIKGLEVFLDGGFVPTHYESVFDFINSLHERNLEVCGR